jgi:signal transduction histidine kinase
LVSNPAAVEAISSLFPVVSIIALLGALTLTGAVILCLVLRFRSAEGDERLQLEWVGLAGLLCMAEAMVEMFVFSPIELVLAPLTVAAVGGAMAVAVLRYRLLDIDVVLNRALVYGSLTLILTVGYVGVVQALGALFRQEVSVGVSLVATALVAVVFAPLRHELQRAVDRLLYGDRHDPYRAIARLGRRLGEPNPRGASLEWVVEEVVDVLGTDYAAVELDGEAPVRHGRLDGRPVAVPLVLGGEPLGRLLLGMGSASASVSRAEAQLVADLARQVAVIAYAARLTADLQRSRTQLVNAVEDERRRLRRDLHDGLGPSLAAVTLKLDAASMLVGRNPQAVSEALVRVKEDVRRTIDDVRRLVYGLRPPALDELGLVGALRARALDFAPGLQVDIEAPESLPELPAAVEVAVYRITAEALTNVSRHAHACECSVRLAVHDGLELEVADNGAGMPDAWTGGVGIRSLYERTAELGGTCTIESTPGGGTRVRAVLPLAGGDAP